MGAGGKPKGPGSVGWGGEVRGVQCEPGSVGARAGKQEQQEQAGCQ